MKKLVPLAGILLVLLVVIASVAPVASAQGITGDKVVMGDSWTLEGGQQLDGNLLVMGGNARIENAATVYGDVTVLGGAFTLDGTVTGNVALVGGAVRLGETAVVMGDLSNVGGSVDRTPGAVVQGSTNNAFPMPNRVRPESFVPDFTPRDETPRSLFGRVVGWWLGMLGSILLMGLLGFVLVIIAPRGVGRVASATAVQPGLTFIFGLLTLVLGVLAGAILLIACGLGLLVWAVLIAAGILGWIGVALWLGQRLLQALKMRSASSIAEVLVGVVIITFLSRLPCIGWLFWLVFISWGLGAVVMTRFGTRDADAPSRPAPVSTISNDAGGSGGGFAPLPETSEWDLVAPPVAPPAERVEPVAPAVVEPTPAPMDDLIIVASEPLVVPAPTLIDISGIDTDIAARLEGAGIRTVADLAAAHPVELATATGLPVEQIMTEDWIGQAQRMA